MFLKPLANKHSSNRLDLDTFSENLDTIFAVGIEDIKLGSIARRLRSLIDRSSYLYD